LNMLKRIGVHAEASSDPQILASADKLILPGVGAFDAGMQYLNESGLMPMLQQRVLEDRVPVLGICLGMQLLLGGSEEGELSGLGFILGTCKKFNFSDQQKSLKVPHMGWNLVKPSNYNTLFYGLQDEARFYFVHSYHAVCDDISHQLGVTHYGDDFTSAIQRENIYGAQFHPEKSHRFGMILLKNFVERA